MTELSVPVRDDNPVSYTHLFDSTVYDDICSGLKNLHLPEEELRTRAYEAMELVGLDTKRCV